jgi:hypothetical protein
MENAVAGYVTLVTWHLRGAKTVFQHQYRNVWHCCVRVTFVPLHSRGAAYRDCQCDRRWIHDSCRQREGEREGEKEGERERGRKGGGREEGEREREGGREGGREARRQGGIVRDGRG